MTKKTYKYVRLLCSIALLCCACQVGANNSNESSNSNSNQPADQRKPSSSIAHQRESTPFDASVSDGLKTAWLSFTKDGQYRIALPDDFSYGAKRRLKGLVGIYLPLLFDINLDAGFDDLAVIVVDTSREDPTRFGLVVFSAPKGDLPYEVGWVLKNRDLSGSVLSRASARLVLTEYRDNEPEKICFVKWDPSQSQYSCEK